MSTAKKIKEQITKLKEALSKVTTAPTSKKSHNNNINILYKLLLLLELCQRGSIVALPTPEGCLDEYDDILLESIIHTAGKTSLFDEPSQTNMPTALGMGVFAIGGMIAEKLMDLLALETAASSSPSPHPFWMERMNPTTYKDALKRCKEVNDVRLLLLLHLDTTISTTTSNGVPKDTNRVIVIQRCIFIARSYYIQAGYLNPEQPIMWKRALDISLKLPQPPEGDTDANPYSLHTILPIQKLLVIASSKGNIKKTSEFHLKLSQSYLSFGITACSNKDVFRLNHTSYSFSSIEEETKIVKGASCIVVEKAEESLRSCDLQVLKQLEEPEQDSVVLYYAIRLQILLLKEKLMMQEFSLKHQVVESKGTSITSTATKKKKKELCMKLKENNTNLNQIVGFLLLSSSTPTTATTHLYTMFLHRLFILSTFYDDDTDTIISFTIPIILCFRKDNTQGPATLAVVRLAAQLLFNVLWKSFMLQSSNDIFRTEDDWISRIVSYFTNLVENDDLDIESIVSSLFHSNTSGDILSIIQYCVTTLQLKMTASITQQQHNKISSNRGEKAIEEQESYYSVLLEDASVLQSKSTLLSFSLTAGYYYILIHSLGVNDDSNTTWNTFEEMIPNLKKSLLTTTSTTQKEDFFGTSYLQFICLWGGALYNPNNPWRNMIASLSSITGNQASDIISNARACLLPYQSSGGTTGIIFNLLCDLGDADRIVQLKQHSNITILTRAKNLYLTTLQQIQQQKENEEMFLLDLLCAYCYFGSCKTCLELDATNLQKSHSSSITYGIVGEEDTATDENDYIQKAEEYARLGLNILQQYDASSIASSSILSFFWKTDGYPQLRSYYLSYGRKLLADTLLQQESSTSSFDEVRSLYSKAIEETPNDYEMNLAWCSFSLRSFLSSLNKSDEVKKPLQKSLLKCAKLDPTNPDAFALLGIWYKVVILNTKRSEGCFAKALLLDPCHSLAGRGYISLFCSDPFPENVITISEKATSKSNNNTNGWSWKVLGMYYEHNSDLEHAILCYQHALRCQDIEYPNTIESSIFFFTATASSTNSLEVVYKQQQECSYIWSLLANCYYHLGKYSASLRAYTNANDTLSTSTPTSSLPPSVLCSWGQVQLELGLFSDATGRFDQVLLLIDDDTDNVYYPIAAYGIATCLFYMTRHDIDQGKYGLAMDHLNDGEDVLLRYLIQSNTTDEGEGSFTLSSKYTCALKLLGQIYTFASILTPCVFSPSTENDVSNDDGKNDMQQLLSKLEFVSKGEVAYHTTYQMILLQQQHNDNVDHLETRLACAAYDLASNQFIQSTLLIELILVLSNDNDILKQHKQQKQQHLLEKSIQNFKIAIDIDPYMSCAWCGLACCYFLNNNHSLLLLAQHCLCRCLQLDKTLPDAWANLALIYIHHGRLNDGNSSSSLMMNAANKVLDSLTQIADIPFIWIGRGLLLEMQLKHNDGESENDNSSLQGNKAAADAYRAALQVSRHPLALLGLAACSSRTRTSYNDNNKKASTMAHNSHNNSSRESCDSMIMYLHSTGGGYNTIIDQFFGNVMLLEEEIKNKIVSYSSSSEPSSDDDLLLYDRMPINNIPNCILEKQLSLQHDNTTEVSLIQLINNTNNDDTSSIVQQLDDNNNNGDHHDEHSNSNDDDSNNLLLYQLYLNPENWKYWYNLSKELIQKATSKILNQEDNKDTASNDEEEVKSLLHASITAANKAYVILMEEQQKGCIPTDNNSHLKSLSDVLSLLFWLHHEVIISDDDDELQNELLSTTQEITDDDNNAAMDYLQKALVYNPENELGRAGLQRLLSSP